MDEGFPVVSFNAWETDFAGSPFVALSSELLSILQSYEGVDERKLGEVENQFRRLNRVLLTKGVPGVISLAGALASIEINEPLIAFAANAIGTFASIGLEGKNANENQQEHDDPITYLGIKKEIIFFRNVLKDTASLLSEGFEGRPLIIIIDELDRCRPLYAVELLEIAKHFFSVDQIVFILAIDRTQLAHAIKSIYGGEFDATEYLRRFIDLDFRLPDPDRKMLVNELLKRTDIESYLERHNYSSWGSPESIQELLLTFFGLPVLSLRRVEQAIHRLGLVFASLPIDKTPAYLPVAVALILRTIDSNLYHQFFSGDVTEREVSEAVFNQPEVRSIQRTDQGALFEAMLIVAHFEDGAKKRGNSGAERSDLWNHYSKLSSQGVANPLEKAHAQKVMNILTEYNLMVQTARNGKPVGFSLAVQRLELFSTDLIDNAKDS